MAGTAPVRVAFRIAYVVTEVLGWAEELDWGLGCMRDGLGVGRVVYGTVRVSVRCAMRSRALRGSDSSDVSFAAHVHVMLCNG